MENTQEQLDAGLEFFGITAEDIGNGWFAVCHIVANEDETASEINIASFFEGGNSYTSLLGATTNILVYNFGSEEALTINDSEGRLVAGLAE